MYSAAAAWLMTNLTTDPLLVSLVQVATSLPMFLFALPAGAITDIVDKRRYLAGVEVAILVVAVVFATMVTLDLVTAPLLLVFMFVVSTGSALDRLPGRRSCRCSCRAKICPLPSPRTASASTSAARSARR